MVNLIEVWRHRRITHSKDNLPCASYSICTALCGRACVLHYNEALLDCTSARTYINKYKVCRYANAHKMQVVYSLNTNEQIFSHNVDCGANRSFGHIQTLTRLSVKKSTQKLNSSVKRTSIQWFSVHLTWSRAQRKCCWTIMAVHLAFKSASCNQFRIVRA